MSKPKDIGHEEAEKAISELEKQFKDIYSQAQSEVQEKMNNYLERFKKQDEKNLQLVSEGKMSEEEYQKWRQNRVFAGKQWRARLDTLAADYTNANRLAMNAINGALPEVYADNFNYAAYLTEQQVRADLSYQLVDRWTVQRLLKDDPQLLPAPSVNIPKDKRWNRQKIMSAVTQGIIQGESMQKIARRLKKVTDMNSASAIRNARTAVTGAECAGRVDSYKVAESKGVQMVQVWKATLDGRTRHSHAAMDGEEVEPGEEFSNKCRYPGDPQGDPSEVYNCRCTILGHVKGYEHYHQTRWIENGKEQRGAGSKYGTGNLGDESYDEWKARHKVAAGLETAEKSENKLDYNNLPQDINERMSALNGLISRETGLKSMFNGKIIVDEKLKYNGTANYDGSITLTPKASTKTQIHELLHQHSIGGDNKINVYLHKNVEEGSVELLAQEICKKHGIEISQFDYSYSTYVDALKLINEKTKAKENNYDFAMEVFSKPLSERGEYLKSLVNLAPKDERRFVRGALSKLGVK